MNALEMIMANEKVINDNILQMSENLRRLYEMVESLAIVSSEPLQPLAPGDEGTEDKEHKSKTN